MSQDVDFRSLGLEEAWNYFKSEANMNEEAYRKARFGVDIMFDINEYLLGYIRIKGKTGQVIHRATSYNTEDFFTELEMRERIIKEWLIENLTPDEIASSWDDMEPKVEVNS